MIKIFLRDRDIFCQLQLEYVQVGEGIVSSNRIR